MRAANDVNNMTRNSPMKRTLICGALLCFFAALVGQQASAQKTANLTGSWAAVTRMPDRNINEQWTIQQSGDKLTGKVKTEQGELPFVGTIDSAGFIRIEVTAGDMVYKVRATLDNDSMDGSITIGNKEHIWAAKKSKSE
jgi:hypothetical protein